MVVALHGFTLSGAQYGALADAIHRTVLAPDLPGHGRTTIEPVTLERTIEVVAGLVTANTPPLPLIGYSLGARLALLLALDHPELVRSLVLLSGSVGIEDEAARRTRRKADGELADHIEAVSLDEFLDGWTSEGLTSTAHLSADNRAADRAIRADNTSAGLAAALRGLGQGEFPYLGGPLGELTMPVLAIAGEDDEKYVATARAIGSGAPQAEVVIVPGAGHNVLSDAGPDVAAAIYRFLEEQG